jgi:GDP-L-fucose synthase
MMFDNKKVLITGGNGMIGRSLVKLLDQRGAIITVADISEPTQAFPNHINFKKVDLRYFDQCEEICSGQDFIFNLVGIKGSPKMCAEQPADFMVPMLQFNTNMMEAARRACVEWYLFTSSVGVYAPSEIFREDDVANTVPSPNDRFAGWAKRIGEMQAEAYSIQYGWDRVSIVRPANVYGEFDNFNPNNAMVIPSLIRKSQENDLLEVWGDGSQIRDFIHSDDVAAGMIFAVENKITEPLNLGSGDGCSIKEIVDLIVENSGRKLQVNWLLDKPAGDKIRLFDMTRCKNYGFEPKITIKDGIVRTINWFKSNRDILDKRYNVFEK